MGLMCAATDNARYLEVKGQLATNTGQFSAPFYGQVILHPETGRMDIHINCFIETVGSLTGTSQFGYFTLRNLLQQCGVSGMAATKGVIAMVTPFGNTAGTDGTSMMGRAGLVAQVADAAAGTFSIARLYSDGLAVGGWPVNAVNVIVAGRGYAMDFYGLQYE